MSTFAFYFSIFSVIFSAGALAFSIWSERERKRQYFRERGWGDPYRRT